MYNIGGADALIQKWERVLEGIDDEYVRRTTATLLENQAKSIIAERVDEAAVGGGTTTVGHLGTFQKFAFPLVRRVFPELIANKIVGVQPMSGPVSQIFYIGSTRSYGTSRVENIYSKYNLTYKGDTSTAIGSRPEGLPGTTRGTGDMGTDATGVNIQTGGDIDLSSILAGHAGGVTATFGGGIASWPDAETILGWTVSAGERLEGTSIPEMNMEIQQQPVIARTRKMRALWTLEASQDLKAYHNLDLERELTELLSKELTLEIDRELLEDLRMIAYDQYNVDSLPNDKVAWDKDSLDLAKSNNLQGKGKGPKESTSTHEFGDFTYDQNADVPTAGAAGAGNVFVVDLFTTGTLSPEQAKFAPQHIGHSMSNLLAVLNYASQDIYTTTHRGPGTVLVTSPLMASMLESAAKLEGGLPQEMGPTNMGKEISYKGKFAGKYELYVDPLWPQDEILVGYKGSGPMDAGFAYCPYIPLQQLPTITDPESFQPRKGILTRYGKAAVQPASRFYRIVRVIGINDQFLDIPGTQRVGG